MALLGIGFTGPILFLVIAPVIVAGILARMGLDSPTARALCLFGSIYPFVWLAMVYLMWSIAWRVVGHHPSPGNDDPSHISPFVSAVYEVAALMFLGLPLAFLLGLVSLMLVVETSSPSANPVLTRAGIVYLGVWISFGLWWALDPGEAIEWFFD